MLMQLQAIPTAQMKWKQTRVQQNGSHQVIAPKAGCLSWWKLTDYDGRDDGIPSLRTIDEGPAGRVWSNTGGVGYSSDTPGRSVGGSAAFGGTSFYTGTHLVFTGTRTVTLFVKLNTKSTGQLLALGNVFKLSYHAGVDRFRLSVTAADTTVINIDSPSAPAADKWYWIQVCYDGPGQQAGLRVVGTSTLQLGQNLGAPTTEAMTWANITGGISTVSGTFSVNGYLVTGGVCRMQSVGYWSRLLNEWEAAFLASGVDYPFAWPTITFRCVPERSAWTGGTPPDPIYTFFDEDVAGLASIQMRAYSIDGSEAIYRTEAQASGDPLDQIDYAPFLDQANGPDQVYLMARGLNASGYPITPWSNVVPGREYPADTVQSGHNAGLRSKLATPATPTGIGRTGTGPVTVTFTPTAGYAHEVWADYDGEGYALIATLAVAVAEYADTAGNVITSYRVRAVGHGEPSDWIESLGVTDPPGAPTSLVASENAGDILLTWTLADALDSSVEVFDAFEGSSLTLLTTLAAHAVSHQTNYAWGSGQRAFRIDAVNAAGRTASAVHYKVPDAPQLDELILSGDTVEISWTHPAETGGGWVDTYGLRRRVNAGSWETLPTVNFGTITNTDDVTALVTDDEIDYEVRALKGALASPWTALGTITIV